ncbi:inositol phospholipid synthesis and fat-storage-inducing TM-domain-containing protein [Auriculariales sp. MPI-PUGE-AT-0066]|nr:inositol phospholipid synthesis and fat-storage-inducing TM-domain-containing protein [Auriculariales sp. MPI-PUGE-AT-0066]
MAILNQPVLRALVLVTSLTVLGTAWSIVAGTYLDTSNPLITNLPHPKHATSYFASKRNIFNTLFVKRAWGWTTLAIVVNTIVTSERRAATRAWRWGLATLAWLSFAMWFFGPSVRARLSVLSGAECIVQLPTTIPADTQVITIPAEFCIARRQVSVAEHAELFQSAFMGNTGTSVLTIPEGWKGIPKLTRGHDVSGHVFLLSLSILTIVDNLSAGTPAAGVTALSIPQLLSGTASVLLVGLWYWMLLMTSVYFHSPGEKFSGLIVGIVAFFFTRIPSPFRDSPVKMPVTVAIQATDANKKYQ